MDKHLKALAPLYLGTKFIRLDAEVSLNLYNLVPFSFPLKYILLNFIFLSRRMHPSLSQSWLLKHCLVSSSLSECNLFLQSLFP